ncbi:MAG TPA: hypothetical protein VE650_05750 [Acetobacteraceae bacterium]|nr:hypothetical protein [Acetobacteraceae bacterium]
MKAVLVLLGVVAALPSAAGDFAEPLCSRPEVVDYVRQQVGRSAPYGRVLAETVTEWPAQTRAAAMCAVAILDRQFDGRVPILSSWLVFQYYKVRWLAPGYEVTMTSPPAAGR